MDISFFNISISIIGSVITLCVLRVSILRLYIFRYYSDGVIIVLFHFIPRSNMYGVRSGRDRMMLDLQLPQQSVPITTDVMSSNPVHGEVC
jgi:hypothetical protein